MQLKRVENKEIINKVKNALMEYSRHFAFSAILDSNKSSNEKNGFEEYDLIAAFSNKGKEVNSKSLEHLDSIWNQKEWRFISVSYDLKNELENLTSRNRNIQSFPILSYFTPEILLLEKKGQTLLFMTDQDLLLSNHESLSIPNLEQVEFKASLSKETYIGKIEALKTHITRGDIYEANFCQEYFIEGININPEVLWAESKKAASTPFSVYYKINHHHLVSGSPERFLKKSGSKLISQPIKGTIKRGKTEEDDLKNKLKLEQSLKDQNENVMIVDLVRNDLSRLAEDASVNVDELYGIYGFSKVFHMISTISCTLKEGIGLRDVFQALFPMGSMTGAPKLRAMELIEEFEEFQRGIYSGTVGYIDPEDNFDFNVVIRSLVYNSQKDYLSYAVGGAITNMSNPESEWEECKLKAQTMELILANYASRAKKLC